MSVLLLQGCETVSYYSQAAHGQLSMLAARESVQKLIDDPQTDDRVRTQLIKTVDILAFAEQYGLPVEKSYSQYVDLERPFVVWNVFAAEPDSTRLKTHCFPIAGCVGYKGYFNQYEAEAYAEKLKQQGLDVLVGGVVAYSTLGWFNDPLLNTFLFRSDDRLAAILFHELAHKVFYVPGDTVFNESYATTVERYLLKRWLEDQDRAELYGSHLTSAQRRDEVIELILTTREELAELYAAPADAVDLDQNKAKIFADMKASYETLRATWGGGNEFAGWMAQDLNNAHLAAIGAYQSQVKGLTAILQRGSLDDFLIEMQRLAEMEKPERDSIIALAEHCDDHKSDDTCPEKVEDKALPNHGFYREAAGAKHNRVRRSSHRQHKGTTRTHSGRHHQQSRINICSERGGSKNRHHQSRSGCIAGHLC